MSADSVPTQEVLEAIRRQSGLRLDREARFWLHDEPITHARTLSALHAGMALHERTGEPIVRVGREWAYVEVEDTPAFVVGLEGPPNAFVMRLADGEREPLVPRALVLRGEAALYTRVRDNTLPARFLRAAWQVLSEHIELDAASQACVVLGGQRTHLARGP